MRLNLTEHNRNAALGQLIFLFGHAPSLFRLQKQENYHQRKCVPQVQQCQSVNEYLQPQRRSLLASMALR